MIAYPQLNYENQGLLKEKSSLICYREIKKDFNKEKIIQACHKLGIMLLKQIVVF
jgi:hypothetical protein